MIARISSGNFIKGAIVYNDTKVEEGEASTIDMQNFITDPETPNEAIYEMMVMCQKVSDGSNFETAIKKPVFSCSLNLNQVDLDKIKSLREEKGVEAENDLYRRIAQRYMEGMGYGKQPYIVYKHEDIERTHIHIVSIRVDSERRKINDSNEKLRSERVRNEIAEEFGLSNEGEKKSEKLSKEEIKNLSEKRSDYISKSGTAVTELAESETTDLTKLKHKISNVLKFVDENYHPKNMGEYNKILSQFNIKCNPINVIDKDGKRINGCQFGVINDKGEFISHLMKGGQINEKFTLPKLEAKFALANGLTEDMRKQDAFSKKYITNQIDSILKAPRHIDMDYFIDTMRVRGVEVNLVTNNEEKVVGINFIDNLNGKVFTGSSLGREYSYGNISKNIEKHNQKADNGLLEKDVFSQSVKLLTSAYNEIRKENYYLESDLIKDLPSLKEQLKTKLMDELSLTETQASKSVDSFVKFKKGQLPSVEAKENGYQQNQIITAMMFATKMTPEQQGRVDLLHQMGISIKEKNGDIIYFSEKKPDVWLSFKDATQLKPALANSEEPIKEILAPSPDALPLGKTERQFVKEIAEGGDGSKTNGNVLKVMDYLDKETLDNAIGEKSVTQFASCVKSERSKSLKESGMLESDFILSIESFRQPLVNEAKKSLGIGEQTANALFDKYAEHQKSVVLPDVESREMKAVANRMDVSLKFAQLIEEPAKRTEFMKRMEIDVNRTGNDVTLSFSRKPSYSFNQKEIKEATGIAVTPQTFIFAENKDVKPFSKKERDFVKDYISGENMMDGRNAAALSYLGKSAQDKAKAVGVSSRVNGILNAINTRTPDEMVKSLLYRGFVIHPTTEQGKTVYKVSRFNNKSPEAMATLPKHLSDRLENSNFAKVYPTIKGQFLDKGVYGTAKLVTVMKVSRAGDFNDEKLLRETINDVSKVNKLLADKMTEAATPTKNGSIDYERVARLVAEYNGEREIKLPMPTADAFIRNESKRMETVVNELKSDNALSVAIKLMEVEDKVEEEVQQNNKKQIR